MPDDPTAQVAPAARCMWCSAVLPSADLTTCPSCGATLIGDGDTGAAVPGLTAIDADAILRNARAAKTKSRGGLLGWISGDYEGSDAPTGRPESLAPPSADVRREMLRLELEAQVANAQAEVEAMAADEAIADGAPIAKDILNQEGLFEPPTVDAPVAGVPSAAAETPAPSAPAANAPTSASSIGASSPTAATPPASAAMQPAPQPDTEGPAPA